jgi:hypothetical protein
MNTKRVIIASVMGLVCGFICLGLIASSGSEIAWPIVAQVLSARTLIGIAIGLSCFTIGHFTLHGMIMGLIFGLPLAFSGLMAPDSPEYSKEMMFISTVVIGMIYGLLIEFVTSGIFKAKAAGN